MGWHLITGTACVCDLGAPWQVRAGSSQPPFHRGTGSQHQPGDGREPRGQHLCQQMVSASGEDGVSARTTPHQQRLGFCFVFSGQHLRHVEVPRLGVESELQLPAYTTATATRDPSLICDLHRSSQQHRILNPLSEARDRTHTLMDTSQVCYLGATTGTP